MRRRTFYMKKGNKYKNSKVECDGILFDSKREANRYTALKALENKGEISDLKMQVSFELIPNQCEPDTVGPRGGIKKGKIIERKCCYVADFTYIKDGQLVVEDTKGMRLSDYIIKRKLMLYIHGIRISEI